MPHHYIDTEVVFQTSEAIHKQQFLWAMMPAIIATQTNQRKSTQRSNQTTQSMQEMLADEADCNHPTENTSDINNIAH